MRGFARQNVVGLGNFWVDLVRATLWVLLPLSIALSLFLVSQGVPMNFNPYVTVATLQHHAQILPQGPVAVLESIKNLGTNGGGFFNTNGAHPYANPTGLSNFVGMLAIIVLPAGLTNTFGRLVGNRRQGWTLFWVMMIFFIAGLGIASYAEQQGNPHVTALGVDTNASDLQAGGNMEGKETRFGIHSSVLTAVTASNGATGSVNSMHDSYTPLGGMVTLVNMLLGEVVFGGLGTGIYSIVMVALIAVFMGGLMVGRTPEYLGKSVTPTQLKLVMLYTIIVPVFLMGLTAVAVVTDVGKAGLTANNGAHGFTEILYAYTSSAANNGENMASLNANSPFYNITLALMMMIGRFGLAIPALALAGSFAQQRTRPVSLGTLPTDSLLFAGLLIGSILIVGALSYFPILALGPIVEHLRLFQ